MPEYAIDDWTLFKVGAQSTGTNGWEPSCQPLVSVLHVAHIRQALNVLRDGSISPQLIYDESQLNTERILVVWLSPNDWGNAGGFRYGNVAFELEWRELVRDKRYYWIGAMDYKPPASRILITDKNREGTLKSYNPTAGDGPWWYDDADDEHYWNGNYCLEFMFEGPVPVKSVESLRFVTHHPKRCSIAPNSCLDRGHDGQCGGARFLAGACASCVLQPLLWLNDDETPKRVLTSAWNELRDLLSPKVMNGRGPVSSADSASAALARSVLAAISEWRKDDARKLVALFKTEGEAVESCAGLIETALGLSPRTLKRTNADDE